MPAKRGQAAEAADPSMSDGDALGRANEVNKAIYIQMNSDMEVIKQHPVFKTIESRSPLGIAETGKSGRTLFRNTRRIQ